MPAARALLRSLVDRQLTAVNAGDASALAALLRNASAWRVPSWIGEGSASSASASSSGGASGSATLDESLQAWAGQLHEARLLPTQVLLDEAQSAAAVEWVLRYSLADDGPVAGSAGVKQILGGTTIELDAAGDVAAWRSYGDGARAHQPVSQLDFGDLDPSLSPWRPLAGSAPYMYTPAALAARREGVTALLRREAALWALTDAPITITRPLFERVFAEDAKLINPWTVELSRESRWEGFLSFCSEYTDCEVDIGRVVLDPERPTLFAVERTFACTNRETGVRGVDEDWALGEVTADVEEAVPVSSLKNDDFPLTII